MLFVLAVEAALEAKGIIAVADASAYPAGVVVLGDDDAEEVLAEIEEETRDEAARAKEAITGSAGHHCEVMDATASWSNASQSL